LKRSKTIENQKTIIVLFSYLLFLKITIAPLCLLLAYQFYQEKKTRLFLLITTSAFVVLWIAKNTVLTGYPFFSIVYFKYSCDWLVPETLVNYFNTSIKNHEFASIPNYKHLSVFDRFSFWIKFDGINGIFNKGILVLFLIAPFTKKIKTVFEYKVLYILLAIHFIVVFLSSPQFRFFLIEFIFLTALVFSDLVSKLNLKYSVVKTILLIAAILPIVSIYFINLKSLTKNKHNQQFEKLYFSQVFLPEKNSKYALSLIHI
jgi:hypothetical protein